MSLVEPESPSLYFEYIQLQPSAQCALMLLAAIMNGMSKMNNGHQQIL